MLLNPSGERNRMVDSGAMRDALLDADIVGGSGPAGNTVSRFIPGTG